MISKQRPVVWLIRPWIEDFSAFDHFDQPIGLLSLGAWLRQNGCSVYYIDSLSTIKSQEDELFDSGDTKSSLKLSKYLSKRIEKPIIFKNIPRYYKRFGLSLEALKAEFAGLPDPQAILITTGMTYWYQAVQALVEFLHMYYPKTPIAVGGIYAGIAPEHAQTHLAKASVFSGQAGKRFFSWISKILGHTIHAPTERNSFLPAWDLVPNRSYVVYTTSRGCLRQCSYCAASLLRPLWKAQSPDIIRKEINTLILQYRVREIALYDDDLGCSTPEGQKHLADFLQMLALEDYPVRWHLPNALGIGAITSDIAKLLYQTGFEQPRLSLHHLDRHLDENGLDAGAYKAFEIAARHLVDAGYEANCLSTYLIAGLAEQKLSWLKKAIDQLDKVGIKSYLAQFSPIPGTPAGNSRLQQLAEKLRTNDLLLTNKIFSVYEHEGWSGEEYQTLALELKNR